ncbi:hypothetical protein niasHT_036382 [Heterodera trifolii]|uniref:Transcription factor CBF/NF-Y/archaeal histone domain-containing protein n=1 Tax=Heterodera trifolii TaxID=157864 RepID=A0ABD2IJ55_9BILA
MSARESNPNEKFCEFPQSTGVILEQDRFLPIANISRIMKRVLPTEGKLSKEAKECVQECITEFILFITSEASERCSLEKRKTISGEDLLLAFRTLGFDEYLEPLEEFLKKYREANKLQSCQTTTSIMNSDSHLIQTMNDGDERSADSVIYLQEQTLTTTSSLQPVQFFYDGANGQYFIPVQNGNDGSVCHITLTPIQSKVIENQDKTSIG